MLTTPESCCNISCGTVGKAESHFMLLFLNVEVTSRATYEKLSQERSLWFVDSTSNPHSVLPLHMCHGLNFCSFRLIKKN